MKKDNILILIIDILCVIVVNTILNNVDFRYQLEYQQSDYIAILLVLIILPFLIAIFFDYLNKRDSKSKKYPFVAEYYRYVKYAITLVLNTILIIAIFSLRVNFNTSSFILLTASLIFILSGIIMPKLKQNTIIGIRTIWTLKNQTVWKKTHAVGRYQFIGYGMLLIAAVFIDNNIFYAIAIIIFILLIVLLTYYSYFEYKKIKNKE